MVDNNAQSPDKHQSQEQELPATRLPDYLTDPDAVSKDENVQWRFGKAPNYANTRRVWAEEKKASHVAGSLAELVENLVKNWEVEASFKTRLSDWRTIDHDNYTFAMNGEAPQSAEHMLKCGTYNAIIQPNEYYSPLHSDFASSHKTFKRMMPTFAWEVMEVYSGPPKVAFKWRHWGVMKNDYVGFNDKGEKVTAKAHGGSIEIFGVTVASVNDKVQLQKVDTYMDPLAMFRQIAPHGIVNRQPMNRKVELSDALDADSKQNGLSEATASEVRHVEEQQGTAVHEDGQERLSNGVEKTGAHSLVICPFVSQQHVTRKSDEPNSLAIEIANFDAKLVHNNSVRNHAIGTELALSLVLRLSDLPQRSQNDQNSHLNGQASDNCGDATDPDVKARSTHQDDTAINGTNSVTSSQEAEAGASGNKINPAFEVGAPVDHPNPQGDTRMHPDDVETCVTPDAGEAVAAPSISEETQKAYDEMSNITPEESMSMMNVE